MGNRYFPISANNHLTQKHMEEIFNTQSEIQEELTDTPEIVEEEIDDLPADDAVLPAEESSESEESVEDTEESSKNEIVSEQKPKEDKLSAYEKVVLAEMERRAEQGDTLVANALKSADKNIHACWQYVTAQAKKKAVGNCAMIEDSVVYSWAHHYYIESKETIDEEMKPKATAKPKAEKKPAPKKEVEKETKKADTKKKDKIASNPLLKAVSKKKTQKDNGGEIVTEVKKGGKVFTITEFTLF